MYMDLRVDTEKMMKVTMFLSWIALGLDITQRVVEIVQKQIKEHEKREAK